MLTVCNIFYALLVAFGVSFWRLNTKIRFWFLGFFVLEVAYIFAVGYSWRISDEQVALSFAAATGVANGGLVPQGITLFPIWATLVVFWAHSNQTIETDA